MKKKVTRTYKTKSGIVTKTYFYDYKNSKRKSTRSKTLVSKSGKINKKNVADFKKKIDDSMNLSATEKRSMKADLDAYVKQRSIDKQKLTVSGFQGHLESDKMARMFANLGAAPDEIADEYGFDEDDLLDENNWTNGIYTDPTTVKSYRVNWTYTGSAFEEI